MQAPSTREPGSRIQIQGARTAAWTSRRNAVLPRTALGFLGLPSPGPPLGAWARTPEVTLGSGVLAEGMTL